MLCSRKVHSGEDLQAEASNCNTWCTVWCGCLKTKKSKIDWCAVVELQKFPLLLFLLHSSQTKVCELQGWHRLVSNCSVPHHWPYQKCSSSCLLRICFMSNSASFFQKYCHLQPDLKLTRLRVRPTAPLAEITDGGLGLTPSQRSSTALHGLTVVPHGCWVAAGLQRRPWTPSALSSLVACIT